jgi:hypothetical protein
VSLAPHAERAGVDEGDLRVAVVARRGRGQEAIEFLEKRRVVVVRLPPRPVGREALSWDEV